MKTGQRKRKNGEEKRTKFHINPIQPPQNPTPYLQRRFQKNTQRHEKKLRRIGRDGCIVPVECN